jgi:alpha-aminoadipate carrier protein LysW
LKSIECPQCSALIKIPEDVVMGEILDCPDCGTELEVIEVKESGKIEISTAEIEGEDWGE